MAFEFHSPCLAHRGPFSDTKCLGNGDGRSDTSIEVQKKANCRGERMCRVPLRGRVSGRCASVGRPCTPGDELSLHLAGSRNIGDVSGFQFGGFLWTPSTPPGAGLGHVGLTE